MVKTKHHEAIPMPGQFPTSKTIPSLKSNKSFVGLGSINHSTQSPRLPSLSDLNPSQNQQTIYPQGFNPLNYRKTALGTCFKSLESFIILFRII